MMQIVMERVLNTQGYPSASWHIKPQGDEYIPYLTGILIGTIRSTIIIKQLIDSNMIEVDREVVVNKKIGEVLSDSESHKNHSAYGPIYCKWVIMTIWIFLDNQFENSQRDTLYSFIYRKFPEAAKLGKSLSNEIKQTGFETPSQALDAMVKIRDALKLNGKIFITDSKGKKI